jgi:hypothetical protein
MLGNEWEMRAMETEMAATLDDLLREGDRRMILAALEVEVTEGVTCHREVRDARTMPSWFAMGGAAAAKDRGIENCHGPSPSHQWSTRRRGHLANDCHRGLVPREYGVLAGGASGHHGAEHADAEVLRSLTHFNFPAAHWKHIQSTDPIESSSPR